MNKTVGVLALQGGFEAHAAMLRAIGAKVVLVRAPEDLDAIDGLVLPGGESSVQLLLLERGGLAGPLAAFARSGAPILATCAGLILSAARVTTAGARDGDPPTQPSFGFLDVSVARNAYGRQLDSFEGRDDDGLYDLVFIRAPRIAHVGPGATVLARLRGEPVLVRQGAVIGAAFHPELTNDRRLHALAFGG